VSAVPAALPPSPQERPQPQTPGTAGARLRVDPVACDGRGLCAELVPELVSLDDWGFPVLSDQPVPDHLLRHARRAAAACPTLALRLTTPAG